MIKQLKEDEEAELTGIAESLNFLAVNSTFELTVPNR